MKSVKKSTKFDEKIKFIFNNYKNIIFYEKVIKGNRMFF